MSKATEITVASTTDGEHKQAAQALLDAAHAYWRWRKENGLHGAVLWIKDDSGRLLVFTRSEYSEDIQRAIQQHDGLLAGPMWGNP